MRSHEMASQIMAVQIDIPTTARLSEYLDPDSRALGAMENVARKCDKAFGIFDLDDDHVPSPIWRGWEFNKGLLGCRHEKGIISNQG